MLRHLPASAPIRAPLAMLRWGTASVAAHVAAVGALLGPSAWWRAGDEDDRLLPAFVAAEPRAAAMAPGGERVAYLRLASGAPSGDRGTKTATTRAAPRTSAGTVPEPGPGDFAAPGQLGAEEPELPRTASDVDRAAQRAPDAVNPPYPVELARMGIEGFADLQFVVDTLGHVEEGSAVVLGFTHRPFADAVLQTLPRMRYSPAVDAGERVRQMVQQRFMFQLLRPAAPDSAGRP